MYSWHSRSAAKFFKADYDTAIADITEAIRLDPKVSKAFTDRSQYRMQKGELSLALEDADEAIRLAPRNAAARWFHGYVYVQGGRYEKALEDYDASLNLDPNNPFALSCRALLRAACPDPTLRDPKKALEDAKQACELVKWGEPVSLDAYAAACAADGDFEQAIKYQEKVVGYRQYLKTVPGSTARKRLELYKAKKPYRFEPQGKIE